MKPLPHRYVVRLSGGPDGYGSLAVDGLPELRAAAPAEFDGPGDAWSPEHLLLASVEACFLLTAQAVARASKVAFTALTLTAEGTVDKQDGVMRFTEIVLKPRLVLAPGADTERARRVLDKSGRTCLVTASLATPVRLEPEIVAA
jgi:peroxiredoxin-like protein